MAWDWTGTWSYTFSIIGLCPFVSSPFCFFLTDQNVVLAVGCVFKLFRGFVKTKTHARWADQRPRHGAITQNATVLCRSFSVWLISNVERDQRTFHIALRWWPTWRRWLFRQHKGLWSAWGSRTSAYLCLIDIHTKWLNVSQSIRGSLVYNLFGCGPLIFLPVGSLMDPQNTGGLQSLQKSDCPHEAYTLTLTCSS